MKTCLTVAVLFVFLQVAIFEDADTLSEAMFCLQKLSLDRKEMEKVIGDEQNDIPEDNQEFNEFAACYMEKKGFLKANGQINFALILEAIVQRHGSPSFAAKFNSKIGEEIIKACKGVAPGSSKGQTAIKVFNCLTRKVKGH